LKQRVQSASLRATDQARGICCQKLFNAHTAVRWEIGPLATWQSPSWCRWGKTPFRAPHPVLLANTVFGVRVAAVVQHKIVLVEPESFMKRVKATPGRICIWRWPPINNLRPASRIFIELAKYCYTTSELHLRRSCRNIDILPKCLEISFDFCNFNETANPRYLSAICD
jgi:hypothetical protein